MANISEANVDLTFPNIFELAKANTLLVKCNQNPNLIGLCNVWMYECLTESNIIRIHVNGRWCADFKELIALLKNCEYSGILTDAESGNDFFQKIIIEDSVIVEELNRSYLCKEHFEQNPNKNYWMEDYYWVFEEPNWRDDYSNVYKFFLEIGVTEKELKEYENEQRIITTTNHS